MKPVLLAPHRIAEPRRVIQVVSRFFALSEDRVQQAIRRMRRNGIDWEGEAAYLRRAFRAAIRNRHAKR